MSKSAARRELSSCQRSNTGRKRQPSRTAWAADIGAARAAVKCQIAETFTFFVSCLRRRNGWLRTSPQQLNKMQRVRGNGSQIRREKELSRHFFARRDQVFRIERFGCRKCRATQDIGSRVASRSRTRRSYFSVRH